jgi:hypothetical protein
LSLVADLRAERKARLIRLGACPKKRFVERPVVVVAPVPIKADPVPKRPLPMQVWLDKFEPLPEPTYPTVQRIKQCVCDHFKVSIVDMDSARRTADIVMPRHIGIYLARKLTPRSFPDITRKFGRRDHTTGIFAAQKIERLLKTDADLAATIEAIEAQIGGSNV